MPKNRISKSADGRYLYSARDPAGKRHQIASKKGELRSQFSKRCDALDAKVANITIGTEPTFDVLYQRWLTEYQEKHCSLGDRRGCNQAYKFIKPAFGFRRLSEIKRSDVYDLLTQVDDQGFSRSTLKQIRATVSRPYAWAIDTLEMDLTNPVAGLRYKTRAKTSQTSRKRFIIDADAELLFKELEGTNYEAYSHLLYLTGWRPSEGMGLRREDIRPDGIHIQRAWTSDGLGELKNASSKRITPITQEIRHWLDHQLNTIGGSPWLFPSVNGHPSLNAATLAIKSAAARAGIVVTPYDFRHTFATKMAPMTDHKTLQYLMGHADIQTTMKYYVEVTEETLTTAATTMAKAMKRTT